MNTPNNETRERLLNTAEELFATRGYASVRLRDIAQALGMRHASLYYYVPGGKEELFFEVMKRNLERHHHGLTEAIAGAGDDLQAQMVAVIRWLVQQPPMDLARLRNADLTALAPGHAEQLMNLAFDLRLPIKAALQRARAAGEIDLPDLDLAAMALISLVQSLHNVPEQHLKVEAVREHIIQQTVDMLLYGWLKR